MASLSPQAAALQQEKRNLLNGATADQKTAIKYFIPDTGCFAKGVKDADYEAVVKRLVESANTFKKAIDKIGLDESELQEIPPVTLYGYEDSKYSVIDAAGNYKSNLYSVTHLFFSSTQVYMYQIILNTMKNDKKERTEEYFYKDITNFSTSTESFESKKVAGGGCKGGTLTTTPVDIQKFALIVPGDRFSCSTYGDIEDQVKAMKNKLREKKA